MTDHETDTVADLIDAINALRFAVRDAQGKQPDPWAQPQRRSVFMSTATAILMFPNIADHLNDTDDHGVPKVWEFPFGGDVFSLVINDSMGDLIDAV